MQDNIAQFEHQARSPHRMPQYGHAPAQFDRSRFPERSSSAAVVQGQPLHSGYEATHYEQSADVYDVMDTPNFSPFPVLRNPPPNVPPTDEQKEANLEKARVPVLSSNDPEMQLNWAQDVLAYVEVAMQNEARLSVIQPPRSQTPPVERRLREDAMNIVNFLAEQYHPKAEFIKGMWLEFGKFGFRVDKKEAFRCYSRAAEKGYARAEYRIGMQFESSGEPEKAIRHYEKGVHFQDSASYYVSFASAPKVGDGIKANGLFQRLGMMILLGQHGQRQDYQMGLDYISRAAESCDENAPQGAYVRRALTFIFQ
jgi:TPR repeat protein